MVRLWDPKTGTPLGSIPVDATAFMTLAFAPDGKTLAVGTAQGRVVLADVATRKVVATFQAHEEEIRSVAFSPDGKLLASAGNDRLAKLWDVSTQSERAVLKSHQGPVQCVQFTPDGKTLATSGSDGTIRLWDPATGAEKTVLTGSHQRRLRDRLRPRRPDARLDGPRRHAPVLGPAGGAGEWRQEIMFGLVSPIGSYCFRPFGR